MYIALALFAVTYILMLVFSKYRTYIAIGSGLIFLLTGMLPVGKLLGYIDFNVLLMIVGMMGLVALFVESRMPVLIADLIMRRVPSVKWAVVALALLAGIISAFVDNVATVLMIAPVAIAVCKKLNTNPVPAIIAIAVSSNLQGAATLVGDTTAIMLGSALHMSFTDFFWYENRFGIFFAVELGALVSAVVLFLLFRKENGKIPQSDEKVKVTDFVPSILLVGTILMLVGASFIPTKPDVTNGIICCGMLLIGMVYTLIRRKKLSSLLPPLRAIDFQTIGLLFGLFLMIGGITEQGVIAAMADLIAKIGEGSPFLLYTVIVWGSVLVSAFIDNIPYVATMIPVIGGIATRLGIDPTVLYFGLISGATLGGNCTPIGASANITAIGILRQDGYTVKNRDFFRIGIPFTLAAIIPAYIYFWLVFGV